MTRLHFGVNFGIERSIGWVWSIRANAGCHEHRRSKFALMNIQISKCDPYREKFLLTERAIRIMNTLWSVSSKEFDNGLEQRLLQVLQSDMQHRQRI